jgi:hypothetical protein
MKRFFAWLRRHFGECPGHWSHRWVPYTSTYHRRCTQCGAAQRLVPTYASAHGLGVIYEWEADTHNYGPPRPGGELPAG